MKKVGLQVVVEKRNIVLMNIENIGGILYLLNIAGHQMGLTKAVVQYCNKIVLAVSTVIRLLGARPTVISFCKRTEPYKP